MCDEAVDGCLTALKFVPDWFVTNKIIKNLYSALFVDGDVLFFHQNSGNVTFSSNKMGILSVDLNNINIDDANYYEDYPTTIYFWLLTIDFWFSLIDINNAKHLKKK